MQTSVDFSPHVTEVLNRNNIQIRSLEFVDRQLREEFTKHRKKAILLIRNKVYEREINPLDARVIDVFDTQLIPYLKKGQLILLVLPTGGVKRYVMQTKIDNIFMDRFRLVALDPRNSHRFPFSHPVAIKIRPIGDATVIRIQTGEARVVRLSDKILTDPPSASTPDQECIVAQDHHSTIDLATEGGKKGGVAVDSMVAPAGGTSPGRSSVPWIKDILCPEGSEVPSDDYRDLEGLPPLTATLLDISCGGMCVSLRHEHTEHIYLDQLLAVECTLANSASPAEGRERVALFLLAIVRNIKHTPAEASVNLQFLANLPSTVQRYWKCPGE